MNISRIFPPLFSKLITIIIIIIHNPPPYILYGSVCDSPRSERFRLRCTQLLSLSSLVGRKLIEKIRGVPDSKVLRLFFVTALTNTQRIPLRIKELNSSPWVHESRTGCLSLRECMEEDYDYANEF